MTSESVNASFFKSFHLRHNFYLYCFSFYQYECSVKIMPSEQKTVKKLSVFTHSAVLSSPDVGI